MRVEDADAGGVDEDVEGGVRAEDGGCDGFDAGVGAQVALDGGDGAREVEVCFELEKRGFGGFKGCGGEVDEGDGGAVCEEASGDGGTEAAGCQ